MRVVALLYRHWTVDTTRRDLNGPTCICKIRSIAFLLRSIAVSSGSGGIIPLWLYLIFFADKVPTWHNPISLRAIFLFY